MFVVVFGIQVLILIFFWFHMNLSLNPIGLHFLASSRVDLNPQYPWVGTVNSQRLEAITGFNLVCMHWYTASIQHVEERPQVQPAAAATLNLENGLSRPNHSFRIRTRVEELGLPSPNFYWIASSCVLFVVFVVI